MTKNDRKTVENCRRFIEAGNHEAAARVMSTMMRAATTDKKRQEVAQAAQSLGI